METNGLITCQVKVVINQGERHREDEPAFDSGDVKEWWLNGQRHREDGPAVEWSNGTKRWWLDGVKYTEEEFNHWLSKKQLNERLTEQLEEKPSGKKVKIQALTILF